eukprot:m.40708 g.40708  ORF g.40708 m.40708 type:complete len:198 (-) comp9697_c0_seq1:115-708(-)
MSNFGSTPNDIMGLTSQIPMQNEFHESLNLDHISRYTKSANQRPKTTTRIRAMQEHRSDIIWNQIIASVSKAGINVNERLDPDQSKSEEKIIKVRTGRSHSKHRMEEQKRRAEQKKAIEDLRQVCDEIMPMASWKDTLVAAKKTVEVLETDSDVLKSQIEELKKQKALLESRVKKRKNSDPEELQKRHSVRSKRKIE